MNYCARTLQIFSCRHQNTYSWYMRNTNNAEIFYLQPLLCKIVMDEQF